MKTRSSCGLGQVVLATLLLLPGCAADRASPNRVLQKYAEALQSGHTQDAYALLSTDARRDLPYAAFERMVRENPGEMQEISRSLLRPVDESYVTATVTGPDGQSLQLVYEGGGWLLDASALDLYSQATPQAALTSFIRAFEAQRYDVLLRFVPSAKMEGMDEKTLRAAWQGEQKTEMQQLVQTLKGSLSTLKVEQLGDRATLSYGSGGSVEMLREQGNWKIEEF
ncbi:MAG TPA: hypothetical protein VL137_17865 [Polyangiaceae bacterium]|nr:hypothetical protein [Polyangiaceae bacterium]